MSETAFFPIAPLLPGGGLIFAIGVLASDQLLRLSFVIPILILAGFIGNLLAFKWGEKMGELLLYKFPGLNEKNYKKTHDYFNKHGGKAFLFSRFVPVVRALIPFVAGTMKMDKTSFYKSNILSVTPWVITITFSGYFLGGLPFIKQNFSTIILMLTCIFLFGVLIVSYSIIKSQKQYSK